MTHEEAWGELRARVAAGDADHRDPHRQRPAPRAALRLLHGAARAASSASSPSIHLKAFTAVEIHYFAKKYGDAASPRCWRELREAGLDSLPGGGAEIFAAARAQEDLRRQVHADEWLDVHRIAHRIGLRSNCTMLYGHIETVEERVDHMLRLRALQDETGGFQTFIPLAFHPDNNALMKLPGPTGVEDLRTFAVARLMLDNIPHIKAYWIMLGVKIAQIALCFGADDLDGTVAGGDASTTWPAPRRRRR